MPEQPEPLWDVFVRKWDMLIGIGCNADRKDSDANSAGQPTAVMTSPQNAFVFVKPHANTPGVVQLVKKKFNETGIVVLDEGEITGEKIDAEKLIDQHYYAIASKATIMKPAQLNVPTAKFKETFGEEWGAVLAAGKAFNAIDACAELGITEEEIDAAWGAAKKAGKLVKFGGGYYCALLELPDKPPIYTFNAFFMTMRKKFTSAGTSIHYFVVEFDASKLSWADFRGQVLGPTDPAVAPASSLRGTIFSKWRWLGLKNVPNTGDNGVHASASPFEALAERSNWLQTPIEEDRFGKALLEAGISSDMVTAWMVDPQVAVPGDVGKKASLFDQLEDLDFEPCKEKAVAIAQAQPGGGACAIM